MPTRSNSPERFSFANIDEALPLPDLVAIQRDSFKWFLDRGLAETFNDISPIEDFTGQLSLELEFDPTDPDLRPPPKFSVEECKEKDMTYAAPVFVRARFMNAGTGEIKEQTVFMGDFPVMTDKGTFIVNGTERVVVSQLVRSPGVIFQPGRDAKTVFTGTIHPYRGEWIEFDVEAKPGKDVTAGCRVARKRRLSLFVLLRALGYEDQAFLERFVRHFDFLEGQWEKEQNLAPTREEALLEIYKRARPGEPLSVEAARQYFENAFFNPKRYDLTRVGRYKLNRKLGPGDRAHLRPPEDRPGAPLADPGRAQPGRDPGLLDLHAPPGQAHGRRRVDLPDRRPGPLRQPPHPVGRRAHPEPGPRGPVPDGAGRARADDHPGRRGHHAPDPDQHPPGGRRRQGVLRHQPAVSQFMDQNNPLSGLAHKRRLSALGPGGLSRERAGFEVRDVHTSHYGRMCPIETPEGPNIGLIGSLATYARVNEYGFIETPYRKVVNGQVTDEIMYLAADEEEEHVIAQASAALDAKGRFTEEKVLVRRGPQGTGVRVGAGHHLVRHDLRDRLRAPGRGRPHGRLAEADRVGLDRPDPLRRARRRQPGPDGRQHAEAGGAAGRPRGPLHRHRRRGPCRP